MLSIAAKLAGQALVDYIRAAALTNHYFRGKITAIDENRLVFCDEQCTSL